MTAYTEWGSPLAPSSWRRVLWLRARQVLGAGTAAAVAAIPGAVVGYIAGCAYLLLLHVLGVTVTSPNDSTTSPLVAGFGVVLGSVTALCAGLAAVVTWRAIGSHATRDSKQGRPRRVLH